MTQVWTERDGHDDNYDHNPTDDVCDCGEYMDFVETGSSPPTRYEPGEVYGYLECRGCGEIERI